ncbi:hypothetical protein ACFCX4_04435 [Kitasatospora sp. NPDC056327]|uniref:hypothetical protein n=1 Tax=Kitasatospora sp. NPDC056327 TaxID=3345785 RepID=UPI0035DB243C
MGQGAPVGQGGRRSLGFGRKAPRALPPVLDLAHGDEELRRLRDLAEAGDWDALGPALAAVGDQAGLTWLLHRISSVEGTEVWLARTVAERPGDTLLLLLAGARQIAWAWEARTGQRSQHVTEEQWRTFGERLETAEEQLLDVAEREPGWLAPWFFLQIAARGASLGRTVATTRFDAAVRRDPGHLASHQQRLQQLCAKWGGSHEEMHAFARTAMLAAPEGSPFGELVALAHLEHWLDLPDGEDHAYLTGPAVRSSLREAVLRSVLHPAYRRRRDWRATHNAFAMVLALADERELAHAVFATLDDVVTDWPWYYLGGDEAENFRVQRDRCAPR